jgi:hypothetical protein
MLYDPTGARVGRSNKVFLTDAEEALLDLSNGSLANIRALETPFGRVGMAISRDAFYPPYMQRLDDLDVDLVIQPEAYGGWSIANPIEEEWLPESFMASGWLHTQNHRSFQYSLNAILTGNFFDIVFDGQSHIAEKMTPSALRRAYIGQTPVPGFAEVGPWVIADPGVANAEHSVRERRRALREAGQARRPGSQSGDSGVYVDSVIAADLRLPAAAKAPSVPVVRDISRPLSLAIDPQAAHQRHPQVVSDGARDVLVAWQDARSGVPAIHLALSSNGGTGFEPRGVLSSSLDDQRKPAACRRGSRVAILWQQGAPGNERIHWAHSADGGANFSPGAALTGPSGAAQWDADCGFIDEDHILAVWTDFASGVARLMATAAHGVEGSVGVAVEVDSSSSALARLGGTQAQAAVSPEDGHVVWLDYRERSWDVRHAQWLGAGFSPSHRVDRLDGVERLHGNPDVVSLGAAVMVAYTDLHGRRGRSDIGLATSNNRGVSWSEHRAVPGGAEPFANSFASAASGMPRAKPALVTTPGGARMVFQDNSPAKSAIFTTFVDVSGFSARPARLDDTADAPVSLTAPKLAAVESGYVVAWEDNRDGPSRVFATRYP